MDHKVFVFTRDFRGAPGYDLVIHDPSATVQDYLDALNAAIARLPLARTRRRGARDCFGCEHCCAERAPLTVIDCLRLREAVEKRAGGETEGDAGRRDELNIGEVAGAVTVDRKEDRDAGAENPEGWHAFFDRYTTVTVQGPVVDIVLKRNEDDGRCIFLDRRTKLCRVYSARPFVCQTFICSPASRRALELREAMVNKGEDELVRLWLTAGMVIHRAHNPRSDPRDWPSTPFAGKTRYSEVLLREILTDQLWKKMRAEERKDRSAVSAK